MNDRRLEELNKEIVENIFNGKKVIVSKLIPRYPISAERELKRVMMAYNKIIHEELKKELGPLMKKYRINLRGDIRLDDMQSFFREVRRTMQRIAERVEQRIALLDVALILGKIAESGRKYAVREWKRIVSGTLGVNLLDDYYNGDFFQEIIQTWVSQNTNYIQSVPTVLLDDMRQTILDGFADGEPATGVQTKLQDKYNVLKRRALMMARDQMTTLNADITRAQRMDSGVSKYMWMSCRDDRVRDCHRELDGKIFSWDDPPEMWIETKSRGRVYTGRNCNPGEDYGCRCIAIPVFEAETLTLPIGG